MDLKEKEKELEDLRQQLLTMQEQLQKNDTMRESELKEPKVLKSTADLNNQLENCGEQTCYKKSEAWQEETEKLTTVFENAETEEGHVTQNIDEGKINWEPLHSYIPAVGGERGECKPGIEVLPAEGANRHSRINSEIQHTHEWLPYFPHSCRNIGKLSLGFFHFYPTF